MAAKTGTTKAKKRPTDERLADLAQRSKDLSLEIEELRAKKARVDDKVIKEMERRRIRSIEIEGIKITLVVQNRTQYDLSKAADILPAKVFRSITVPAIEPDKLAAAVRDGAVEPQVLAQFASVTPSSPYIRVSIP